MARVVPGRFAVSGLREDLRRPRSGYVAGRQEGVDGLHQPVTLHRAGRRGKPPGHLEQRRFGLTRDLGAGRLSDSRARVLKSPGRCADVRRAAQVTVLVVGPGDVTSRGTPAALMSGSGNRRSGR